MRSFTQAALLVLLLGAPLAAQESTGYGASDGMAGGWQYRSPRKRSVQAGGAAAAAVIVAAAAAASARRH